MGLIRKRDGVVNKRPGNLQEEKKLVYMSFLLNVSIYPQLHINFIDHYLVPSSIPTS